ncbi:MAG TPA: bifunctional riboflavin kinase/FAD synthetase [Clostridia bacterium]
MTIITFGQKINSDIALALGFFDSVHIGHRAVISKAVDFAKTHNIKSAVLTYSNNPFDALGIDQKLIFTFEERLEKFEDLGVDFVIHQDFDQNIKQKDKLAFAEELINIYGLKYAVCGQDYRFGKDGLGDVEFLRDFFGRHSIQFDALNFVKEQGFKISSSDIRKLISDGDIKQANKLLGEPFYMRGRVAKGNGCGKSLGFPTINFDINLDKILPRKGVYITKTIVDGKSYISITNVGDRPTFSDNRETIETHILGLEENLYNRDIKIEFYDYLRPISKFENIERLTERLKLDVKAAQDYFRR